MTAGSKRLIALCFALAVLVALAAVAQAAVAPPANDDFAHAQVVRIGDHAKGTITAATLQAGEPATSSPLVDHTVWYRLTTTATEAVRIDTCGANPYSELAVYSGASVDALVELAHSQYDCAGGGRVYLTATAGTTYFVRVSGYEWGAAIALDVGRPQAPPNDDFALAAPVGLPADVGGSTVDATVQPGEVDPSPYGSGHSVWYRFTPASDDAVTISLVECGDAAGSLSQLTVYTGDGLGGLTEVGDFGGACGYRSRLTLLPKAGTTYRIAVRGSGQTADAFRLHLALVPSAPNPVLVAPPSPKCPFELAAPGSVTYRGTHSGGGEVCVTVKPGFSGVSWFTLADPPIDLCVPFAVERYEPALPIVGRRFSAVTSSARVTGTFGGRSAHGTFQPAVVPGGAGVCSGRIITWTASTLATPPPSISDETPPALRLRTATAQQPLRSGRVTVSAHCPLEACAVRASATVAGVRLESASRTLAPNVTRALTLRLSTRARRAIRRQLRSRRSIRTRVVVVALDVGHNTATARRTITLRR